jgi:hypothetical protein
VTYAGLRCFATGVILHAVRKDFGRPNVHPISYQGTPIVNVGGHKIGHSVNGSREGFSSAPESEPTQQLRVLS